MTNHDGLVRRPTAWEAQPPPGWAAMGELCRAAFERLDEITLDISAAIRAEVPEFGDPGSAFSPQDVYWSTIRNTSTFLHGVAENRPPHADEIEFRRLVGRRTAMRGVPLQALISTFHVAYRELWSMLVAEADAAGGDAPAALLEAGSTIWRWMLATTNSVAEGYQQETSHREAAEARAAARFVDLVSRDAGSEESRTLAKELGFDADGRLRALAADGGDASVDVARTVIAALQRARVPAVLTQRGRATVIVAHDRLDVLEAALETASSSAIGVGSVALGLEGAQRSLAEAEHALELATHRGSPCWFERDWLAIIALTHRTSIDALLAEAIRVARDKPHLAETIKTFACCDFSIAEGARRLRISQNSFRYRMNRWHALTGTSPWTHEGLTRAMTAIERASHDGTSPTRA